MDGQTDTGGHIIIPHHKATVVWWGMKRIIVNALKFRTLSSISILPCTCIVYCLNFDFFYEFVSQNTLWKQTVNSVDPDQTAPSGAV